MERPKTASERRRRQTSRWFDCRTHRCAGAKRLQGIRSDPRRTRGDGRRHQGFQGRHDLGDRTMSRPDTPFPRHWLYYIALKILLVAGAIALVLKLYGMW